MHCRVVWLPFLLVLEPQTGGKCDSYKLEQSTMEEAEQTQPPPLDLSVIKDDAAWRSKCATFSTLDALLG